MSPNVRGACLMMASMAAFTMNDALLKLTGGAVPLMQLLFVRGILASFLLYGLARSLGALRGQVTRHDWTLIGIRSGAEIGAAYFFLTALFNMPLANVTAILQVLPLTVTMGAAMFFGEAVGWRRWLAIGIGFLGMVLIVQPGTEGFNVWSIYALIAVVFVTIRDLATRRMSRSVPSLLVTLAAAVAVTCFAGVASLGQGWAEISPLNGIYIVASAVFILGGYLFSVMVMRVGEISFIAPFRYTALIWALVLGWFVFGDWPEPMIIMGAVLIVVTGLFTLTRETRHRTKNPADVV
ncbi:DMT family transporter [Primorskyibacter sp. S187A]|uniref:DMT family transporter n=1 Tax=Primorskyibacter sp. S187A TaxID=3415130 RepID=UPI003C7CE23F